MDAMGPGTGLSLLFAIALAPVPGWAGPPAADATSLYQARCAVCHGDRGDGQGQGAYLLNPRPRNFKSGSYRLRSTPTGSLPTDADLARTIAAGIPGTSMPAWRPELSDAQIQSLVAVVKSFNPRFAGEPAPAPIPIPAAPPATPAIVAVGRQIYERMSCASCHGPGGRGDGPASPTLKDENDFPIRPYDFTLPGRMKGGDTPADVYRAFSTGLDGTPMPDFSESLKPDERWQLVHYLRTLARPAPEPVPTPAEQGWRAARAPAVPADPSAPAWAAALPVGISVRPLWSRDDAPARVVVRALRSNSQIGLLVEWEDRTLNDRALSFEDFRDAVAIQFPMAPKTGPGSTRPFLGMGDAANPVNVWQWKADWQRDMARVAGVRDAHPDMWVMTYHDMDEDPALYPARAAGNPFARADRKTAAEDANAAGLGTLTTQRPEGQQVEAHGAYSDHRWRVVFRRALTTPDAGDVQLAGLAEVPVAFAVWDGTMRDRNGQKLFSGWEVLQLAK
jgi:mono/diheme cytochrome c family protein